MLEPFKYIFASKISYFSLSSKANREGNFQIKRPIHSYLSLRLRNLKLQALVLRDTDDGDDIFELFTIVKLIQEMPNFILTDKI